MRTLDSEAHLSPSLPPGPHEHTVRVEKSLSKPFALILILAAQDIQLNFRTLEFTSQSLGLLLATD